MIPQKIISGSYVEEGYSPIPRVFLSDEAYGEGLQCFVPLCTDILPINTERKTVYLAKRRAKPMAGLWWLGGRMYPDESLAGSAIRCFKRETGFDITEDRLIPVGFFEYKWKDRQQIPQTIGCHTASYLFSIALSNEEISALRLEQNEYADTTMTEYDREQLVQENAHQAILDAYDAIFNQSVEK